MHNFNYLKYTWTVIEEALGAPNPNVVTDPSAAVSGSADEPKPMVVMPTASVHIWMGLG